MATRLFHHYGQGRLIRPRADIQIRLLEEAREFVLTKFQPGVMSNKEEISSVLRAFFEFYSRRLDSVLRKVGSRELMEFVLHQYDVAARAWRQTPDEVSVETCRQGLEFIVSRRGLKFLAERTAMRTSLPEFAPAGPPNLFIWAEEAIMAAFMLAYLYMTSDKAYHIFPGEAELELYGANGPEAAGGRPMPFTLTTTENNESVEVLFSARTARDRSCRKKYFGTASLNFDFQRQAKTLDSSFERSFGCSYGKFLHVLELINEQAKPDSGSYPVMFFSRDGLIRGVEDSGMGVRADTLRVILSGFTLTRRQMTEEGRQIFLPNQEHRALRRGYFEFPYSTGVHLAWSAILTEEGLDHLVDGVCFKKLPEEWLTPETSAALESLSNEAGDWFEGEVNEKLRSIGIVGDRCNGRIIRGGEKIDIPAEVGQFDFLGYSEADDAIVVVESKMVEVGFEARFFRNEIAEFATDRKSHAAQLRKKANRIVANRERLARAFRAKNGSPKVVCALVTLYPTFAACRITDLPCVSLVELMEDYHAKRAWPYDIGTK
jgi:hypothetical protein